MTRPLPPEEEYAPGQSYRPYSPLNGRRREPPSRRGQAEPRDQDTYTRAEDRDSGHGNGRSGEGLGPGYGQVYPEGNGRRPYAEHNGGAKDGRLFAEPDDDRTEREQNGRSYRDQNGARPYPEQNGRSYRDQNGARPYPEQDRRGAPTATLLRDTEPAYEPDLRLGRSPEGQQPAPRWRRGSVLALLGVMALQAAISLILTWNNTAFEDEANYLWIGHLELAHWFEGAPAPRFSPLSGSPLIYPPLGAVANGVAGLAGARILSLLFMLAATVLLYSAASKLLGERAAIAAAALWAVSVSALKLGAFATFDPMAVFLVCLSAWLVVQSGFRKRSRELAVLAGLAMAMGSLTAYSYAIYAPALIAAAFCVWISRYDRRRARVLSLWLVGSLAVFGVLITTAMGQWHAILLTTITRAGNSQLELQGYGLVAQLSWQWSGLVAVLGIAGAFAAAAARVNKRSVALLFVLAGSAAMVPLYQLHLRTAWSLDKHIACGVWLASIPAGYMVARVARLHAPRKTVAALVGAGALVFPTVAGWTSVYADYHEWANSSDLIAAVRPLAEARHTGDLYSSSPGDVPILDYYTGAVSQGPTWDNGPLVKLPPRLPQKEWRAYFNKQLTKHKDSVIALEFPVTASTFAGQGAERPTGKQLATELYNLASADPASAGLADFGAVVALDPEYRLVGVVPYSDDLQVGTYVVWRLHPVATQPVSRHHPRRRSSR